MTTKHTPGPWVFQEHPHFSEWLGNIVGSYGKDAYGREHIRTITCQTRYGTKEEQQANARLIAAAPDLLEALKGLMPLWESGITMPEVEAARQAIAKAIGE